MEEYVKGNIGKITFKDLLSFRNTYLYTRGLMLYRNSSTPKLLYLFLKNVLKKEKILVLDDDKRVSGMFKDIITETLRA
jgi:hypothetical protein